MKCPQCRDEIPYVYTGGLIKQDGFITRYICDECVRKLEGFKIKLKFEQTITNEGHGCDAWKCFLCGRSSDEV